MTQQLRVFVADASDYATRVKGSAASSVGGSPEVEAGAESAEQPEQAAPDKSEGSSCDSIFLLTATWLLDRKALKVKSKVL